MKKWKHYNKQKLLNLLVPLLIVLIVAVILWGRTLDTESSITDFSDGIDHIDLNTIHLQASDVEVNFSEVLLSNHNETRKLIVSTQQGEVSTKLTDRVFNKVDYDFLKKTQTVSYNGTGYFVVDLDNLTAANVIDDKDKKIVTIRIGHAYLQSIEIDPYKITIGEVKEGLLTHGDIELTLADYNAIEKELRTRLEQKFDTVANGQTADDIALKMVKEIYEPIVKAIDDKYSVIVEFK